MKVEIFKNTNFGNNDLVWNVPHPDYDFSYHDSKVFENVNMRFPLLTTRIAVQGNYDFNTSFYDYMIITDNGIKTYYFINSIIADRNVLLFSVTLDAITTHNILELPISGTILRKHDVNPNEGKFDYPTALDFEGNYQSQVYDVISYDSGVTRFIESAVNLTKINNSVNIESQDGTSIVIPTLPKPSHNTEYRISTWTGVQAVDDNRAFTLYKADEISENVLNTVRGLSGDGAISDSYAVPTEAISVTSNGAEVTRVHGRLVSKKSKLKLSNSFALNEYVPRNEAIKGMFKVGIMSLQEKTQITFPAWDLHESTDSDGYIKVVLWCDGKPSGAPYCAPDQVFTLYPSHEDGIIGLATLESKSVRGGQWLRNPLIYSTGRGEIFSTIETRLQRERADYEKSVSLHQLELARREREINIAKQDYEYQSGVASSLIGGGASLLSKDFGGLLSEGKNALNNHVQNTFLQQMRDLQAYEQETEKTLISAAHSNNLKNLNIAESIRRIVPREVAFQPNESLGSYDQYNSFALFLLIPDEESLRAKDIEFSKYGYPTYETVENFIMLNNLRKNHTVFQIDTPLIDIGGKNGDLIREVLQSGIRILSKPYSQENILNNPKIVGE